MADEQEEFGVKFAAGTEAIAESTKSFDELGEAMKETAKAGDAVAESTKAVDDKVQQLRDLIGFLKQRMAELADEYKQGIHTEEQYKDSSDLLIRTLKEREELLNRLTAAEREQQRIADEVEKTLEKEAAAEAKVAEAASEAAAKIEEQTRAQEIAAGIADEFEKPLKRLAGEGEGESAEGGLKGVAGGAIKAEKALKELVTGHGLMRLGSQLEGIMPLLGGPAGMGLAIGALVIGVHELIPALKTWFDTFQEGSKEVRDAEKAIKDFDVAQKSVHEDMRKRSLHDVDKQIEALEAAGRGYAEYGGVLNEEEQRTLAGLRGRSKVGHEQEKLDKALKGIGPTKAQRNMGQAVKEAITEVGGVAAVIGENADVVAQRVMESAMEGDKESIETLKQWSPEFASMWKAFDPDAIRHAKQKEAGEKTIADVETKTAKIVEHKAKQLERADVFDRHLVTSEEDRVARENAKAAQDEANDQIKADKKAERDARAAKTKAEHDARQNTPEASKHRALTAQRNEEMGMAQDVQAARAGAGDTMAAQMGPQELQQVVAQVGRNRMMNSTLGFTLAQQVDYYMSQLEAKMVADFTRGMGQQDRSQQLINPRGGH